MTAANQYHLFQIEPVTVKGPLAVRFEAFHKANRHVLPAIIHIARSLRDRGVERASMALIFERLRWLYLIQTKGEAFRLNNNHRAFFSRLVPLVAPDLAGMFAVREQGDDWTPDLVELGLCCEYHKHGGPAGPCR